MKLNRHRPGLLRPRLIEAALRAGRMLRLFVPADSAQRMLRLLVPAGSAQRMLRLFVPAGSAQRMLRLPLPAAPGGPGWRPFLAALPILLSVFLLPRPADAAEGWGGAFPPLDPSARGMAMGGSFSAVASGSEAMAWNPAGLLTLESREISFTYADLFGLDLVRHTLVQFGWPFPRHEIQWKEGRIEKVALPPPASRALGLSVSSLRGDLGDESYRETQVGLGLAWRLQAGIHAGAVLRLLTAQTGLEGAEGGGQALDLGLQRDWRGVRLGFTALNLVSATDWEDDPEAPAGSETDDPLPRRWSAGLAWTSARYPVTLAASGDWMRSSFRRVQYAAGLEWKPLDPLALRTGWRRRQDAIGERSEWSAGMGVRAAGFQIDYAWRESGRDLGDTHRWSASLGL